MPAAMFSGMGLIVRMSSPMDAARCDQPQQPLRDLRRLCPLHQCLFRADQLQCFREQRRAARVDQPVDRSSQCRVPGEAARRVRIAALHADRQLGERRGLAPHCRRLAYQLPRKADALHDRPFQSAAAVNVQNLQPRSAFRDLCCQRVGLELRIAVPVRHPDQQDVCHVRVPRNAGQKPRQPLPVAARAAIFARCVKRRHAGDGEGDAVADVVDVPRRG